VKSRVGLLLIGALLATWLLALVLPYQPGADVAVQAADLGPGAAHWLGTDHLGRDVASRLVLASRAFVAPGVLAALVAGFLGGALGTAAGWYGGLVATAVRYVFHVIGAVPRLVLVLLAGAVFGSDLFVLAVATGVCCAPGVGEAVAARLESLRRAEFVTALRGHGVPEGRILFFHLLWVNARGLFARQLLTTFGFFLVVETTLSYFGGFGVQEPTPSWGNMLAFEFDGNGNVWAWLAPAAAIQLGILGTALVGQDLGLREGAGHG
jgi:peptide/nickel transport system permease protein